MLTDIYRSREQFLQVPAAPVETDATEDYPPYSPVIPSNRLVKFDGGGLAILVGRTGEESFAYAPTGLTVTEEVEGQTAYRFIDKKRELQDYDPDYKTPREVRKYQEECAAAKVPAPVQTGMTPESAKPRRSIMELGKAALQQVSGLFTRTRAAVPKPQPVIRHSRPGIWWDLVEPAPAEDEHPAVWHDLVGPAPETQAPAATPHRRFVHARFDERFTLGPDFTDPGYLFGPEQNSTRPLTHPRTEGLGGQLAAMMGENEAPHESVPGPDLDDLIMRQIARYLGRDEFISAYALKTLPENEVRDAINTAHSLFRKEMSRCLDTPASHHRLRELAATLARLEEICRSNNLPFGS